MGYLVSRDGVDAYRVESAQEALDALVDHLHDDERVVIRDDGGRFVLPRHLLDEAARQARLPEQQLHLVRVMADYVDTTRQALLGRAYEMYQVLTSPTYEQELRLHESQGEPMAEQRRSDAAEREELRELIFGRRSWREAGERWARDFGQLPSDPLLDELARRHPVFAGSEMEEGAEAQLAAQRAARRSEESSRLNPLQAWLLGHIDTPALQDRLATMDGEEGSRLTEAYGRVLNDQSYAAGLTAEAQLLLQRTDRDEPEEGEVVARTRAERARWAESAGAAPPEPVSAPECRPPVGRQP